MVNEIIIGSHRVRIEKDGYEPYEEVVTIRESKREEFSATLRRQITTTRESQEANTSGKVEIRFKSSRTQASVYIDGKYVGATNRGYSISQGKHAIVVRYGENAMARLSP